MPKAKSKLPKWYSVKVGRRPGVYETWPEAEKQVLHFPGAVHQSFTTKQQALSWLGHLIPPSTEEAQHPSLAIDEERFPQLSSLLRRAKKRRDPHMPRSQRPQMPAAASPSAEDKLPAVSDAPAEPELSTEQARILDRIMQGDNFFFTGSAGTGKSVLLRAIIREFNKRYWADQKHKSQERRHLEEQYVRGEIDAQEITEFDQRNSLNGAGQASSETWKLGVTASTGMAAINIGGCTLHSWAGVGLGKLEVDTLHRNIAREPTTRERWRTTSALIIDEISMIDGNFLDKLDQIGRRIRFSDRPFGGIQVIMCGDFHQLPPVPDREGPPMKFAFEAACWDKMFGGSSGAQQALRTVFRQKEGDFVKLLERMRKGRITGEDTALLASCRRKVKYDDDVEPVALYARKAQVERLNDERLQGLETPLQEFRSFDVAGVDSRGHLLTHAQATSLLDRNTLWLSLLRLKVGAQVMLITNMQDGTLVNGSTGIVVDFMTDKDAEEAGIYMPQKAKQSSYNKAFLWPVVEFAASRHARQRGPVRAIIPSMMIDSFNAQGTKEASRMQIPLILSWAMTVHKSQGQSIERLRVDLAGTFETGQAYVALSRATSLETLEIQNFDPRHVMAHPKVIEWSRPFEEEQAADEEWDVLLNDACLDT